MEGSGRERESESERGSEREREIPRLEARTVPQALHISASPSHLRQIFLSPFFFFLSSPTHANTHNTYIHTNVDHAHHVLNHQSPDSSNHHHNLQNSVSKTQQPNPLPSTPNNFKLSLPGNFDSQHSFPLSLQSLHHRHNTFTRLSSLQHGFSNNMASLHSIEPAGTTTPTASFSCCTSSTSGLCSVRAAVSQRSQFP